MKKHELLKYAYDNYPKGTKCRWSEAAGIITSTGVFHFNDEYILTSNESAVFDGNKWAEIVNHRTTIKDLANALSKEIAETNKSIPICDINHNILIQKEGMQIIRNAEAIFYSGNKIEEIYRAYKSLQS